MAEVQVKALYDFDGDTENGELSFKTGDILRVTSQDVGEGWWHAKNYIEEDGLIPESYVEIINPPEPSFPPPPPPLPSVQTTSGITQHFNATENSQTHNNQNGYGGGGIYGEYQPDNRKSSRVSPPKSLPATLPVQPSFDDDWEGEDWSDDDDDASTGASSTGQEQLQGQGSFGLSAPMRDKKQLSPNDMSKYGTVKKSFNRFSNFAKAGGDDFMMGKANIEVRESDLIKILEAPDGPMWDQPNGPYTCSVTSPKKESKLKGLKSYIAYQIVPSFSNIQVSRRYKHFDWLHQRLEEKFPCIPVPPLPDKQISGRYEDDFVAERMKQLQLWVDRLVRNPIISVSEVFQHFLTCTDDKKWKQGKRKSEKDEYQGGKFFLTLQTPPHSLDMRDVDAKMENFCKFVKQMDDNVKHLIQVEVDNRKKHMGPFKREYQKIGHSFKDLAATFNMQTAPYSQGLTAAIDYTGDAYNEIGDLFEKQPKNDSIPLMDGLHEYRGILSSFPDVLKVHEGAVGKAKECIRLQEEQKMTESEVQSVLQRADVISYGSLASVNHFEHERVADYKLMMQNYLKSQIDFYKQITNKLEGALRKYDDA